MVARRALVRITWVTGGRARTWSKLDFKHFNAVCEGVGRSIEPVLDVVVARTFDLYASRRKFLALDGPIYLPMIGCLRAVDGGFQKRDF